MKLRSDSHQLDEKPMEPSEERGVREALPLSHSSSHKASEFILWFLHQINCQEVVKEGGKGEERSRGHLFIKWKARWEQ